MYCNREHDMLPEWFSIIIIIIINYIISIIIIMKSIRKLVLNQNSINIIQRNVNMKLKIKIKKKDIELFIK